MFKNNVKISTIKNAIITQKTCKGCGTIFSPKSPNAITYCSRPCFRRHKKPPIKSCSVCNRSYKKLPQRKHNVCSRKCYNYIKRYVPVFVKCKICDKEFERRNKSNVFCSYSCMGASLKNHEITPHRRAIWKKFSDKYQARKRAVMIDKITLEEVIKRDSSICHICNGLTSCKYNKKNKYSPTIDHVTPLTKGGLHSWDNVKLAHLSCNSKKNNRHG